MKSQDLQLGTSSLNINGKEVELVSVENANDIPKGQPRFYIIHYMNGLGFNLDKFVVAETIEEALQTFCTNVYDRLPDLIKTAAASYLNNEDLEWVAVTLGMEVVDLQTEIEVLQKRFLSNGS